MKKVILLTGLFVTAFGMAQEATCPVTGKTASSAKESAAYDKHGSMSATKGAPAEKGSAQTNKNIEWWPNQLNLDV